MKTMNRIFTVFWTSYFSLCAGIVLWLLYP
jgi:hypothetical protein